MVIISKAKAKRLGIPQDSRDLSRSELTKAETQSGQYTVSATGKTTLTEEARAAKAPSEREERATVEAERITELNKQIATQREPTVLPTIKLEPEELSARERALQTNPELTRALETSAIVLGIGAVALGGVALVTGAFATTAVAKSAIIGKTALTSTFASTTGALTLPARYAVNTKSIALTAQFFAKIATVAKNPIFVASALLTTIGTLPFAGFIKEEALQTLGFATETARRNDDAEGLKTAIEAQEEILNPSIWNQILSVVPFANVLNSLKTFYDAAKVKLENDKKTLVRLEEKLAAPVEETFEESSKRLAEERREETLKQREEDTEFFEKQRKESREKELEERAEDQTFWDEIEAKRKALKEEERADDDAFWRNIYEQNAKRKAEQRAADEEYWKQIKEENVREPWTAEDKKVLDDWNAGKSALNFKWLGL